MRPLSCARDPAGGITGEITDVDAGYSTVGMTGFDT